MIKKKEKPKKTALITGASGGIGKEMAAIYAKKGYDLVLVARTESKLYRIKQELEEKYGHHVFIFVCDLSEKDAAYEVFNFTLENNIDVDVLVNNAGFGDFGHFAEVDWQRQYNLIQVNIVAMLQLTRYFLPVMIARGSGRIMNMSSVAAFCAGPKMSLYYASKAFVRSFSEAIAEEVKGTGVTVTAICPGPTATGFEKAADMKNSKMFTAFKPAKASDVAKAAVRACQKGKVLLYHGLSTKLMNIGARLVPRSVSRKFAAKING